MIFRFAVLFLVFRFADSSYDITLIRGKADEFTKPGVQCKDCYLSAAQCTDANTNNSFVDKTDVCRCVVSPSTYIFAGNDSGCVADKDLLDPLANNESCLRSKSNVVEIVDLSARTEKTFSIKPFTICQLLSNNSFQYQSVDGTWATRNYSRRVFEVKQLSLTDFLIHGIPALQEEFAGHLVRVALSCILQMKIGYHVLETEVKSCLLFKAKGQFVYCIEYCVVPYLVPRPPAPSPTSDRELETKSTPSLSSHKSRTTVPAVLPGTFTATSSQSSVVVSGIGYGTSNKNDDKTTTAVIGVLGATICVLLICVFVWFYLRHFRKRSSSLNTVNSVNGNARRNLPALPNASAVLRRIRQSLPEDHIYCELSEFSQRTEGVSSELPEDLPAISLKNCMLSFENKGMDTDSQHETGHCIEICQLPEPEIGEKEDAKENFEQEKTYQSLKDSERARASVYEPLVRELANQEILSNEGKTSDIEKQVLAQENPQNLVPFSTRMRPDKTSDPDQNPFCVDEESQNPTEIPDYCVLEESTTDDELREKDISGHEYHVLEAPCNDISNQILGSNQNCCGQLTEDEIHSFDNSCKNVTAHTNAMNNLDRSKTVYDDHKHENVHERGANDNAHFNSRMDTKCDCNQNTPDNKPDIVGGNNKTDEVEKHNKAESSDTGKIPNDLPPLKNGEECLNSQTHFRNKVLGAGAILNSVVTEEEYF